MDFGYCGSLGVEMGVSKNSGTTKSSILIGFSLINHPFSEFYPYFWFNTQMFVDFALLVNGK